MLETRHSASCFISLIKLLEKFILKYGSNSVEEHAMANTKITHWPKNEIFDLQETADLVTFTDETLNGKLHFWCSDTGKIKLKVQ